MTRTCRTCGDTIDPRLPGDVELCGLCTHLMDQLGGKIADEEREYAVVHGHPESMDAELDPADEEYLGWLADRTWPDEEPQP